MDRLGLVLPIVLICCSLGHNDVIAMERKSKDLLLNAFVFDEAAAGTVDVLFS